jgi:hypothetical protein
MFLCCARIYTNLQSRRSRFLIEDTHNQKCIFSVKKTKTEAKRTFVALTHVWLIIHDGDGPNRTVIAPHGSCPHQFRHFLALFNE